MDKKKFLKNSGKVVNTKPVVLPKNINRNGKNNMRLEKQSPK